MNEAFAAEQAVLARFSDLCKQCYDAGDMSNFHFYQHLVKWHREGDDKFKGHVAWLQTEIFSAAAQVLPSTANAKDGTIDVVWYSGAFVPRIDRSTGDLRRNLQCRNEPRRKRARMPV